MVIFTDEKINTVEPVVNKQNDCVVCSGQDVSGGPLRVYD